MLNKFKVIQQELLSFTKSQRLFVFLSMVCCFFIAGEYAITRPASNSIFISVFSTKLFPIIWLCTVPLNLLIVFWYNRYLPKLGHRKTFLIFGLSVIGVNFLTAIIQPKMPSFIFFQFMFKDIYILLMFKQLWSLIHSTIPKDKAKYLYGVIFGIGGIGSIVGSLFPSFLAVKIGSTNLFYFTIPIYLIIFLSYFEAYRRSNIESKTESEGISNTNAFTNVAQSKYLKGILFLVIFMQISIALTDFQFNSYLEQRIPSQDLRTEFCGRIVGFINILTTFFQFIGGFMLAKYLGLKKSHLLVPSILLGNVCLFLLFPSFPVITYSLITVKAVDYSLFGIIREMLYIPLDMEGKFKAKAVIDVFAYRTAKAGASFVVICLQAFAVTYLLSYVSMLLVGICICWFFVVQKLFKHEKILSIGI